MTRAECGHVLASAVGEPSEPVEELQLRARLGGHVARWLHGRWCRARRDRLGPLETDHLVGKRAASTEQHGSRRGLQQRAIRIGQLFPAQDEHATHAAVAVLHGVRLARPHQCLQRVVQVLGIRRPVLVEDHQIDIEHLQAPVLVGPQQLSDDVEVFRLVDSHEHDRQVTGDAVRPQARCPAVVAFQQGGRRPQRRVRVEDPVRQSLEQVRLVGVDAEVLQLDLCLRPRQDRGALVDGGLAVLVGEVQCVRPRCGDAGRERRVDRGARSQADPVPQTEDRVQHGADGVRQRPPVDDRHGGSDGMIPAEESSAIRLVLDHPAGLGVDRGDVRGPDRVLEAGPRPPRRQQRPDSGDELGLDEEVLERRVGNVGSLRGQCDLGVRRDLDVALLCAEVGQGQAADLGIVFCRHDDGQVRGDRPVAARELGFVLGVDDVIAIGFLAARLVPR